MKAKLAKLIDVKSIMTLLLTVVFCVLALTKTISGQEFLTIFTVIVSFYFGTQSMKTEKTADGTGKPRAEQTVVEQSGTVDGNAVYPEAAMGTLQPPDKAATVGFRYEQ